MKKLLSERNIVVILFLTVLVTFFFAQEETKKMTKFYNVTTFSSVLIYPEETGNNKISINLVTPAPSLPSK